MNIMIGMAESIRDGIARELRAWYTTGLRAAIWDGTGESAAFLEACGVDAHRFPIVVDSDPAEAGAFFPGTGQSIRFRDWLPGKPVDIILIPCHGRPAGMVRQIDAARITYEGILIPHRGDLVDFHAAEMMLA